MSYNYPIKSNGKEMNRKEKQLFRNSKQFFEKNVTEWTFANFFESTRLRGVKGFSINIIKDVYQGWLFNSLRGKKLSIDEYEQKINEMKKTKLNRSEKIKKECLKILSLKDDDIDLWPWKFGRELSSTSIQNRVKNAISNAEFEEVDCDDPICSSIIDTAYPHPWLKSSFSEIEWSELADVSKCGLNSDNFSQTISKNNMKEINNHFSHLRKTKEYEANNDNNEGTWESHSVTIPFNIAIREINNIRLTAPEKSSLSSKKRKNDEISSTDNDSDSDIDSNNKSDKENRKKRIKRGRGKPDFTLVSREFDDIPRFEYLIGEVAGPPFSATEKKNTTDRRKLYKMMKDSHDMICKHFYKKYGNHKCQELDLWSLETVGFLITGLKMRIFVLDQPGFGIYRIRLVKILDIPVKKNTNVEEYNDYLNRLMYAINESQKLIKNFNDCFKDQESKKNNSNEKFLISSLPPTARTPPR
ncbi:hypothetical protein F8M41_008283 [Gigaspora margarita]|uniref:Uncharacterized protein n=1 Tax=Gigaspora margarita TaxID=4874 RepID=A0A8H3X6Q8_GIGMA|nr:hypothetical protein F8M41_008283 [Gigaspora margarita]